MYIKFDILLNSKKKEIIKSPIFFDLCLFYVQFHGYILLYLLAIYPHFNLLASLIHFNILKKWRIPMY